MTCVYLASTQEAPYGSPVLHTPYKKEENTHAAFVQNPAGEGPGLTPLEEAPQKEDFSQHPPD